MAPEEGHMKAAQWHAERLEASRLYRRREHDYRRTQAEAKARAQYYLTEQTADIWPGLIPHLARTESLQ